MKTIYKIAKSELNMLFCSPIAWLILVIFIFQVSMDYANILTEELKAKATGYSLMDETASIFSGFRGLYSRIQGYLYLYIPLLTMGIMSREFSTGSIKLLFSSPITNKQIVLGKFYALMVYAFLLLGGLVLIALFSCIIVKSIDFPLVLSGLLGLYLLTCAYIAIGLFMSSLTSYQVVAAMGTLAILAVLNFIGGVGQEIALVRDITYWLSISGRSREMINGLICSEDVLYFLIVIALFVVLTILRLRFNRKKGSQALRVGWYTFVVGSAMFLGYLSSRPVLMYYYDTTAMKSRTLTSNSQAVMEKMDGGLTITTYVNLLDDNYWDALPRNVNNDFKRFKQYVRFKPEIKMKYVYYYDKTDNPSLDKRFPNLTDKERAQEIAKGIRMNFDRLLSPEKIREQIDLSSEGNHFVRVIERENGQRTFLRIFNDMSKHPSETEITAALKRLVQNSPKVAFLIGHEERDIYRGGDGDYSTFTMSQSFRYSLINQGFDTESISLAKGNTIPDNIDILVIADPQERLTEWEINEVNRYIASGRHLLITTKPGRQMILNEVTEPLGVHFQDGIIVQQSEDFAPDLVLGHFTPEAEHFSGTFAYLNRNNFRVTAPGTAAILFRPQQGFQVFPLVVTDSMGCWIEKETTDFVNELPEFHPKAGEEKWNLQPIVLAMRRQIAGKDQRIMILGNADCLSNGELARSRKDIKSANFNLILETFRWFTNGEYPVNTSRSYGPDDDIRMEYKDIIWVKIGFMGILPLLLIGAGIIVWIRRREK